MAVVGQADALGGADLLTLIIDDGDTGMIDAESAPEKLRGLPEQMGKPRTAKPCMAEAGHPSRIRTDAAIDTALAFQAKPAEEIVQTGDTFTVTTEGRLCLRSRHPGDTITLPGGTKLLKKVLIDRKIPAAMRLQLPVFADETGVLGIYSIGVNEKRRAKELPAIQIQVQPRKI